MNPFRRARLAQAELLDTLAHSERERANAAEAALALRNELTMTQATLRQTSADLETTQGILVAIQGSLSEVAVYEGLGIGASSLTLYINELVRDHEELERRIDLAVLECRASTGMVSAESVLRILRGGVATPDEVPEADIS